MRAPLFLPLILFSSLVSADTLTVKIEDLRSEKGTIEYLVFDNDEGYPDRPKKSIRQGSITPSEAKNGFKLSDLPSGNVALTFIHDENSNKKLDKKGIGLPDEGVGFSNNPRIFFGVPSFNRVKFKLSGEENIVIRMKYF